MKVNDFFVLDLFNEIINEFDFGDVTDFNDTISTSTGNSSISPTDFYQKEDPLLSLSNTNMNYNLAKPVINAEHQNVTTTSTMNFEPITMTSTSQMNFVDPVTMTPNTVIYQLSDSIHNAPLTVSSPNHQPIHATQIVNNVQPVQIITTNQPANLQSLPIQQKYKKNLINSAQLNQVQQIITTNSNETSSIMIPATVMYTTQATPRQNIQLLDGTTILATHVPTIMVSRDSECSSPGIAPPKEKEVKKTTHNAIERRYRTSINDKIVELKNMLVGVGGKLNKSAILKRTIDKISDLENENYDLKMENARLREMVTNKASIENSTLKNLLLEKAINRPQQKRRYTNSSMDSSAGYCSGAERMSPPPTSDESNPSLSPARSDGGSMLGSPLGADEISSNFDDIEHPSAKRMRKSATSQGMSSNSKLALCVFMFAIITINPLASFLSNGTYDSENSYETTIDGTRRYILQNGESTNVFTSLWQIISGSAIILTVNCLLVIGCLIKIFVYGDPIMNSRSPAADQYAKQRRLADDEFRRGNADAAFAAYLKCLRMYGVTLPETWFDLVTSMLWQFVCSCLHRLHIGQWLSWKYTQIFRSQEVCTDALNSAQELAVMLNRCNQIHFSRNMKTRHGMLLSMYAVNMAEMAYNISPLHLVDIYLTAALRCRRNYPHLFSWICSRYYLYKAKSSALFVQKLPLKFDWIFGNSRGYRFICKYRYDSSDDEAEKENLFSSNVTPLDPVMTIFKDYNEHLLNCGLQCLIGMDCERSNDFETLKIADATAISEVLRQGEMLKEREYKLPKSFQCEFYSKVFFYK